MPRPTVPHDPSSPDRVRDTTLEVLVREETDDRTLRRALGLAAAAHLLLFGIHFPDWSRPAVAEPTKEIAYVVNTPIFEPKPDPPPEIPERRVTKVPIPDPTPGAPEPIRDPADTEEPLDLDLPMPVTWAVPEAPPDVPESGPVQYRSEMKRPRRIHDPPPAYTEAARKAGVEGVVILEAILDEEGRVTNVRIAKDLPFGLGESAARAVREWRFTPATLNGEPIAVYYHLSVHFGIQ